MNRRRMLSSLLAAPYLASIRRAEVKPDDVIVIELNDRVSADVRKGIYDTIQRIWPDRKAVILDPSMKLRIVGKEATS